MQWVWHAVALIFCKCDQANLRLYAVLLLAPGMPCPQLFIKLSVSNAHRQCAYVLTLSMCDSTHLHAL